MTNAQDKRIYRAAKCVPLPARLEIRNTKANCYQKKETRENNRNDKMKKREKHSVVGARDAQKYR